MNQETTSHLVTVSTRDAFGGETETLIGGQAFCDRQWLRTSIARAWFVDERSPCPECHSHEAAKPKYPSVARLCDLINSNLPKIRTEPWLMTIYRIRQEINA